MYMPTFEVVISSALSFSVTRKMSAEGCRGLQRAAEGCRGLQRAAEGCRGLYQWDLVKYKALQALQLIG